MINKLWTQICLKNSYCASVSIVLLFASAFSFADSLEERFAGIYKNKMWGADPDGLGNSGSGSSATAAKPYLDLINTFIRNNNIKSILDIGCGDGRITSFLELEGVNYLGIDVVEECIKRNQERMPKHKFLLSNALVDVLPNVDLILCKDVLQHLENNQIALLVEKIRKSCFFAVITNDCGHNSAFFKSTIVNSDIRMGEYRFVDIRAHPFCFGADELLVYDCPGGEKKVCLIIKGEKIKE
jgi:SAM-dependent methyltransferase